MSTDPHLPVKTVHCNPRVGLLCNPHSGRNQRKLALVRAEAAAIPHALYRETDAPRDIVQAIDDFAAAGVELLAVIGGDGTLMAVLTHLLHACPFATLPLLTIIPGGTTNTAAKDLGTRGWPQKVLRRLGERLSGPSSGSALRQRPILKIEHADMEPVYGMVFGAGAVAAAIDFSHRRVKRLGITGERESSIAFVRFVGAALLGQSDGPLGPTRIAIRADGEAGTADDYLLLLASTLERQVLGMRPYWSAEPAPLHFTAIRHRPRSLWRALPSVLRGRPGPLLTPERGYLSRNLETVELTLDGPYVVDGEIHRADSAAGPIRITAQAPVTFLVL